MLGWVGLDDMSWERICVGEGGVDLSWLDLFRSRYVIIVILDGNGGLVFGGGGFETENAVHSLR